MACFLVSVIVRYQQFETWKQTPQAYFVGEKPMMTTLDAPIWLRWAREYNEGTFREKSGLRRYPESVETFNEKFTKNGSKNDGKSIVQRLLKAKRWKMED